MVYQVNPEISAGTTFVSNTANPIAQNIARGIAKGSAFAPQLAFLHIKVKSNIRIIAHIRVLIEIKPDDSVTSFIPSVLV